MLDINDVKFEITKQRENTKMVQSQLTILKPSGMTNS